MREVRAHSAHGKGTHTAASSHGPAVVDPLHDASHHLRPPAAHSRKAVSSTAPSMGVVVEPCTMHALMKPPCGESDALTSALM